MNDVRYASLTSQGVQHRVLYRDDHPSKYQPRPTGLNFGEQTGTSVFPLVIAVPNYKSCFNCAIRNLTKWFPLLPLPVEGAFDRAAVTILGQFKHLSYRTKSLHCSF